MKRLYGIKKQGEIISASAEEVPGAVEMVQHFTDNAPDFTDDKGGHWITVEHLAELFNELCGRTGMKKQVLATLCGKSAVSFSRYCNGVNPVPFAIWKIVEMEVRKRRGHQY